MKKIVVASDAFKGSLTSMEVAHSVALSIHQHLPQCEVAEVVVADGGEGTVDAIINGLGGSKISITTSDPIGRPIQASYGIAGHAAVIEMSAASGLPLLSDDERNPLLTSSHGTGELIADALNRGCRQFLIGLGGSATNDGGTGMLQALGFRFYDTNHRPIERCCGATLELIAEIDDSNIPEALRQASFTVACDVNTPFCGPTGAAIVFAPQKGADAAMVHRLDRGMQSFARLVEQKYGINLALIAGTGAAGGLGGALLAFLNGTLQSGIDMVLDAIGFNEIISDAELLITGEGKIDRQTVQGKTAAGVLRRAQRFEIPTIAIAGQVELCDELHNMGFAAIHTVTPIGQSTAEAMRPEVAKANISATIAQICKSF